MPCAKWAVDQKHWQQPLFQKMLKAHPKSHNKYNITYKQLTGYSICHV